ncbi:MAG: flagellar hook-associated protein 3 [Gammaproteobacteria bacterium]|nr:MAG: flagellar hook-associated protein 3 [Gammaproteobacteria bacterium]
MRVSSSQIYSVANIGMRDAQIAVDKTQQQISSGKRVLSSADDPVAATAILMLNQEIGRTTQFSKNIDSADNNLTLEDTTLQSVVTLITRLKELAVNAGNTAVMTSSDYKAIAAEVDSRLSELLALQNTRNASGQYIFAGFQSETQPFVSNGGGNYSYQGDEGQLFIQASSSVTVAVNDSGKKIFSDIPSANKTFNTSASPSNKANPPAIISVGNIYDQAAFDKLFPQDMVVTFNANSAVTPSSPNYTITDSSGKVLVDKQLYVAGQDIKINGAKFAISGIPGSGVAAKPASVPLGAFTPTDFSGAGNSSTIEITVGGITERLTLDQNITTNSGADSLNNLVTALGGGDKTFYDNPANAGTAAAANFKKLQNLGITLTASGFTSATGLNITVKNGSAATDTVTGIGTQGTGTISPNIPLVASPYDFSVTPGTVDITVNGKTERLQLTTNVTDAASLATALNNSSNSLALAKLGIVATPDGLSSLNNSVITISNGTPNAYAAMGITGSGVSSSQGVLASPGDKFVIESTQNQSLLTTVSRFSEAMKGVDGTQQSKDDLAAMIAKTLSNLGNVMTNIASVQGEVGARQNMLESTKDLNLDVELNSKEILSQLQDVDYAEASTRLQMQTFVLSASQQSFIRVSELSLFKYM